MENLWSKSLLILALLFGAYGQAAPKCTNISGTYEFKTFQANCKIKKNSAGVYNVGLSDNGIFFSLTDNTVLTLTQTDCQTVIADGFGSSTHHGIDDGTPFHLAFNVKGKGWSKVDSGFRFKSQEYVGGGFIGPVFIGTFDYFANEIKKDAASGNLVLSIDSFQWNTVDGKGRPTDVARFSCTLVPVK